MNEKNFLEKMVELLDTEEKITMDSKLDAIEEWDSLSFVSFLAMANTYYNAKIVPASVKKAVKVRDLFDLLRQ